MNGKRYFNEITKEICLHKLFSKLHNYFSTKPQRICSTTRSWWSWPLAVTAFHFVFCHPNLLAPVLLLSTALPSVLLYSHQHTDHHKRLAFVREFQLEELFPRLRIQQQRAVWTERPKTLPFRCALGEDCKHLCIQGEVWWKRDTMRLHRTGFIQICLV